MAYAANGETTRNGAAQAFLAAVSRIFGRIAGLAEVDADPAAAAEKRLPESVRRNIAARNFYV